MDLKKLLERQQELYAYMESHSYSECYINKFRMEIKWISNRYESEKWSSYIDIYRTHEKISRSKDALNIYEAFSANWNTLTITEFFRTEPGKFFLLGKTDIFFSLLNSRN